MNTTYKTLIGKSILVGITYVDKDEVEVEKTQFFGTIVRAGKSEGIIIKSI